MPRGMVLTATSSPVSWLHISRVTPKLPDPMLRTSSYVSGLSLTLGRPPPPPSGRGGGGGWEINESVIEGYRWRRRVACVALRCMARRARSLCALYIGTGALRVGATVTAIGVYRKKDADDRFCGMTSTQQMLPKLLLYASMYST